MRKHVCGKLGETSASCAECDVVNAGQSIGRLRAQVEMLDAALSILRPALKWCASHAPHPDPHGIEAHARAALEEYDRVIGTLATHTQVGKEGRHGCKGQDDCG
jgi:hypothetical protein